MFIECFLDSGLIIEAFKGALIFATCKCYNIRNLISLDGDFKEPCEKEGFVLINSIEVFNMIKGK